VVITVAVGAFLSLIGGSQKVQSKQSVMTTLTFVLDSMTREIRTGSGYYCQSAGTLATVNQESYGTTTSVCVNGNTGLSFLESGSSISGSDSRISYYYDATAQSIMRRVGNGTAQSIVANGIQMVDADFFVSGATRLGTGTDTYQPTVTIILQAQDEEGATTTLQTTVTQRELDI
jgi:hypothetical protein